MGAPKTFSEDCVSIGKNTTEGAKCGDGTAIRGKVKHGGGMEGIEE